MNDIEIYFTSDKSLEYIKELRNKFPQLSLAVDAYGTTEEIVSWPTMLEDLKGSVVSFVVRSFSNSYVIECDGSDNVLQISSSNK